jgi:ribose transport system substrate-binding protein
MKRAFVIAACLTLLCPAVACNRGGGTSAGGGRKTVALALSTLNNPFFVDMKSGAQQAADNANTDLLVADAQDDAAKQLDQINNFVTQQVDAILVNPVDEAAVVPAVQKANQADIPVIALDRATSGGDIETLIASNNVQGGKMAGRELIKLVGSGDVVQLEGIPGTSAARDRGQGFESVIAAQDAVNVVASQKADFDRAEGLDVMQNLYQGHPDIKGVFAQNDEMALGAVKALGSKAGKSIVIVGFDGEEEALEAVDAGDMNATILQHPDRMAEIGVANAVKVIGGESIPKSIPVPVTLITKNNVGQYL